GRGTGRLGHLQGRLHLPGSGRQASGRGDHAAGSRRLAVMPGAKVRPRLPSVIRPGHAIPRRPASPRRRPFRSRGIRVPHPVQRRWYPIVLAVAVLVLMPLSVLLLSWHEVDQQIWAHLWQTQMARLIGNTVTLVLGVGIGVTLLGVS